MKPIIIESPVFCDLVSWFITVEAITLWPFIICRDKSRTIMLNHESIHIKQQTELLVVGFWVLYLLNWIWNLFYYRFNLYDAYSNIIFEKEAYAKESDLDYLKSRKHFIWISYI